MHEITFLIKTFERKYSLVQLLNSIEKWYFNIPIVIVDDSSESIEDIFKENYSGMNIKYIKTDFDIGASRGRNIGLDNIDTEYFLLLDDDFYFREKVDLKKAIEIMEHNELDILGGMILNYRMVRNLNNIFFNKLQYKYKLCKAQNYLGKFYESGTELIVKRELKRFPKYEETDIVFQFFIGKTDIIREKNKWDEELYLSEHTEFFYRAWKNNLKVAFSKILRIEHRPTRLSNYSRFRDRNYEENFMNKYKFTKVIRIHDTGEQYILENNKNGLVKYMIFNKNLKGFYKKYSIKIDNIIKKILRNN